MLEQTGIGYLIRPGDTVHFQGIVRLLRRGQLESSPLQLVVTQDRFICAPLKAGGAPIDIPRTNIASVHQRAGLFARGVVIVDTTMGRMRFGGLDLVSGAALVAALHTSASVSGSVRSIAAAPAVRPETKNLEDRVEQLEDTVERLSSQIAFLEDLLSTRSGSLKP